MIPRWYRDEKRLQHQANRPETQRARRRRIRLDGIAVKNEMRFWNDLMIAQYPHVFTEEFRRSQGWTE